MQIKKFLSFFTLAAISLTTISQWFKYSDYIIGVDTFLPLNYFSINEYFTVWNNNVVFSGADTFKFAAAFPLMFILQLLRLINIDYNPILFEKIILFMFLCVGGISIYLLIEKFFPKVGVFPKIISAIFYISNVYVIYLFNALPIYLMFSYFFFPLVFYFYVKLLTEQKPYYYAVGYGLLGGLLLSTSYATPPYIVLHFGILLFFFLFYYFFEVKKEEDRKFALLQTIIFGLFFILVNSHWIIPTFITQRNNLTFLVEDLGNPIDQYINNTTKFWSALKLSGYFGFEVKYRGLMFNEWYLNYKNTVRGLLLSIVPLIAFTGVIFNLFDKKNRNNRYILCSILLLVFTILVSLPSLWGGLILLKGLSFTPFLSLFRTAYQRFSFPIALFSSLMFAYSLNKINEVARYFHTKNFEIINLIVLSLLLYTMWPFYSGEMYKKNGYLAPEQVTLPAYYQESINWINSDSMVKNPRILILPYNKLGLINLYNEEFNFHYDSNHPYRFTSDLALMYSDGGNDVSSYLRDHLYNDYSLSKLIKQYKLDYIVFHNDINWEYINDNSWWSGINKLRVNQILSENECLESRKSVEAIDIYKVKNNCNDNFPLVKSDNLVSFNTNLRSMPLNNLFYIDDSFTSDYYLWQLKREDFEAEDNQIYSELWPDANYSPSGFLYRLVKIKESYIYWRAKTENERLDLDVWLIAKRAEELKVWGGITENNRENIYSDIKLRLSRIERLLENKNKNDIIDSVQANRTIFYLKKAEDIFNEINDGSIKDVIQINRDLINKVQAMKSDQLYNRCNNICYRLPEDLENYFILDENYKLLDADEFEFNDEGKIYIDGNISDVDLLSTTDWITNEEISFIDNEGDLTLRHTENALSNFNSDLLNSNGQFKVLSNLEIGKQYYFEYTYKLLDPEYELKTLIVENIFDYSENPDYQNEKLKILDKKSHKYTNGEEELKVKMILTPNELKVPNGLTYFIFSVVRKDSKYKGVNNDISSIVEINNIKLYEIPYKALYVSNKEVVNAPSEENNYSLKKINPFTYVVNFQELSMEDQVFILNEKYHEGWRMVDSNKLGSNLILDGLNKMLPYEYVYGGKETKAPHKNISSLYNGWVVNKNSLDINKDYYLVFYPQLYFIEGLFIDIAVIFSGLAIVVINILAKRKNDNL